MFFTFKAAGMLFYFRPPISAIDRVDTWHYSSLIIPGIEKISSKQGGNLSGFNREMLDLWKEIWMDDLRNGMDDFPVYTNNQKKQFK